MKSTFSNFILTCRFNIRDQSVAIGELSCIVRIYHTIDFLMDKYIYDESNGLWYELQGDYYIPCLTLPTEKEHKFIGLWGQRYKRYLQEHKRAVYTTLLTSGKLNGYLADIDEQAMDMMFRLVEQMADKEGVTEQLKAENPMLWVVRMNEIQARAREIINREIIYT